MVTWRMEGTDSDGHTRWVEYGHGEYRADEDTFGELLFHGDDTTLCLETMAPLLGDPRGSEWNWFAAGSHHLKFTVPCERLDFRGREPEVPLIHLDYWRGCIPDPTWTINDLDPVPPLMEDIYQVFRRTRDFPLKEMLPGKLFAEVGENFIEQVLGDNPAIDRRCRAIHWARLVGSHERRHWEEDMDPWLVECFGEPADPAEVDLVRRAPRVYITETRSHLRLEVIRHLPEALGHKLPPEMDAALHREAEAALANRDTSWPRYLNGE